MNSITHFTHFMLMSLVCLLIGTASTHATNSLAQASQDASFAVALESVERGIANPNDTALKPFAKHPLAGYLHVAAIKRDLDKQTRANMQAFRKQFPQLPVTEELWALYLMEQADQGRFKDMLSMDPNNESHSWKLRCHALNARRQHQQKDWASVALRWYGTQLQLPKACDAVIDHALSTHPKQARNAISKRTQLALHAGDTQALTALRPKLTASEQKRVTPAVAILKNPQGNASLSNHPWHHLAATAALKRLAKKDPDTAEAKLLQWQKTLKLPTKQMGDVRAAIALWSAASLLPNSTAKFAKVPKDAFTDQLHQWRLREALSRNDTRAAFNAWQAMPNALKQDSRNAYLGGRLYERKNDQKNAHAWFQKAAKHADYHGFMAADKLNKPYALCPQPTTPTKQPPNHAGLKRAMTLQRIRRLRWAEKEWQAAMKSLSKTERLAAVAWAIKQGWTDRALHTLKANERRHYDLRFPFAYEQTIATQSKKNALSSHWVFGLIRAESAFNPSAKSHANAYGLMQLLPVTGQRTAKQQGLAWQGTSSLFDPETNITLGTAYLKQMLDEHQNRPYLATAAYNAGPNAVSRWVSTFGSLDPDLFIESINYKETREYVPRVMAFATIYGYLRHKKVPSITSMLTGKPGAMRTFACPSP